MRPIKSSACRIGVALFALCLLLAPGIGHGPGAAIAGELSVDDLNVHGKFHVLTQSPAISTNGLVLYYDFDNDQPGIVIDRSGNNNNGAIVGTPTYEPSFRGKGLLITKNGDYVVCPSPSLNANGWPELTVAAWVLMKEHNTPYGWVFSKSQGNAGNTLSYTFRLGGPSGSTWNGGYFQVFTSPSFAYGVAPDTFKAGVTPWPAMNVWYHIVCTYSPTSMRVYVDSALDGEQTFAAPGTPIYDTTDTTFYVGDGGTAGSFNWPDTYTGGTLDEVLVYNRALSGPEIVTLYQGIVQSRVLVDPSGNVGIGTNAPSARVHIVGNLRVDGSVGGLSSPTNPADAATKEYVDGTLGALAPIARSGSAADLSSGVVPSARLTGTYDITAANAAALGNAPAAEFLKRDGSVPWTGNQNTGGKWLSGDGENEGLYIDEGGNLRVSGHVTVQGGILDVAPMGNLSMGVFTNRPGQ